MSTLAFDLNHDEYLMEKFEKSLHLVLRVDSKVVWLRNENNLEFTKVPFHMINKYYVKTDKNTWEVLYKEQNQNEDKENE